MECFIYPKFEHKNSFKKILSLKVKIVPEITKYKTHILIVFNYVVSSINENNRKEIEQNTHNDCRQSLNPIKLKRL